MESQENSVELFKSDLSLKSPEELIPIIIDSHNQFLSHTLKALNYGIMVGYLLQKVKADLHYKFKPYLEKVGINRQTAYNYIFIFENREQVAKLISEGFTLKKIFSIIKGKDEKQKALPEKQKALPENPEEHKKRKTRQALQARLKRARRNKAINKTDLLPALTYEQEKIEKAKNEIIQAENRIEEIKSFRIIEGK